MTSNKGKINALAAVRMMQTDDDEDDDAPAVSEADISKFMAFELQPGASASAPKSILKKRDNSSRSSISSPQGEDTDRDPHQCSEDSSPPGEPNDASRGQEPSTKLEQPAAATKVVDTGVKPERIVPAAPRFVAKFTGLPCAYKPGDLLTFLGLWPKEGASGVRQICDHLGNPLGVAFIEFERNADKTSALRMSGIKFKGVEMKVAPSSGEEMAREWGASQRIRQQIEQSPFVRICNMGLAMPREDVFSLLSDYARKGEDVYCCNNKGENSKSGYCYVIMDDKAQADSLCSSVLSWKQKKITARKVHPKVVARWCRKNDQTLTVRPEIEYDKSIDLSDSKLDGRDEPEDFLEVDAPAVVVAQSSGGKTVLANNERNKSLKLPDQGRAPPHNGPPRQFPFRGHGPPGPFETRGPPPPGFNGPPRINGPFNMMPHPPQQMGPPRNNMGPLPNQMNDFSRFRPPLGGFGPPGMPGPFRGFPPTIYVRMYGVHERTTTDDIKDFFAPIIPAKIAENIGYDIYDVDFYTPADAVAALQRDGLMVRKNAVRLEMLPCPPVPLPPRKPRRKKKRPKSPSPPPVNVDQPPPMPKAPKVEVKPPSEPSKPNIEIPPFPDDPFRYHIKPFDPDTPEGQCAIEPMQGYFCKLCRKFYKHRQAGYVAHCKTKPHYDNVKKHAESLRA